MEGRRRVCNNNARHLREFSLVGSSFHSRSITAIRVHSRFFQPRPFFGKQAAAVVAVGRIRLSPSQLRRPSCRCRNSSTLARPFSDRMGEKKTRVTVRPSRLRLWNVPITFELLTFPRSVQCPQSPSLRQSNVTSSYSSPHLSRRHRVRWPRCCCPHRLRRCLWMEWKPPLLQLLRRFDRRR